MASKSKNINDGQQISGPIIMSGDGLVTFETRPRIDVTPQIAQAKPDVI